MKKILIAGYEKTSENYINILKYLGADPIVTLTPGSIYSFDGLLLPGGGDISPSYFDQPVIDTRKPDPDLDRAQFHILYQFLHSHKPILGICKGMQMLNVFFGGTLNQHTDSEALHQWNGNDQWHRTTTKETCILDKLYGREFEVNSAHHQTLASIGLDLNVIQHSEDGVSEAVCHDFLPLLGVQWHPERMCLGHKKSGAIDGTALFRWFLNPASVF